MSQTDVPNRIVLYAYAVERQIKLAPTRPDYILPRYLQTGRMVD